MTASQTMSTYGELAVFCFQSDARLNIQELIPIKQVLLAASFAARFHRRQHRKDADRTPYINHPIEVALNLARASFVTKDLDTDVFVAALLHDTVEDTDATIEDIRAHFGDRVASIVAEVTDDKSLPKEERKRLQIVNAPHKSREAKLVKLADKLHNLTTMIEEIPQGWSVGRVRGYYAWAFAVVAGLRGTNASLENALDRLFDTAVLWNADTQKAEMVYDRAADNSTLLADYLASMTTATN